MGKQKNKVYEIAYAVTSDGKVVDKNGTTIGTAKPVKNVFNPKVRSKTYAEELKSGTYQTGENKGQPLSNTAKHGRIMYLQRGSDNASVHKYKKYTKAGVPEENARELSKFVITLDVPTDKK